MIIGACLCAVFFVKQKMAYEMRISYWSSDVCSSDLCLGIFDSTENRHAFEVFAGFLGMHTSHEGIFTVRVFAAPMGVELAGLAGNTLGNDFSVFVDQNRHLQILDNILISQRQRLWSRLRHWCRSEEHTSELQSLMRISYAVFCLKKKQ